MRHVRGLIESLVERRLWPVAVLLVVGLVAVPLTLGKKPAPVTTTSLAAPVPDVPGPVLAPPDATMVAAVGSGRGLAGLVSRNPFRQHVPKAARAADSATKTIAATTVSTAATTATTTSTPSAGGSSGTPTASAGGGAGITPTVTTPAAPKKTYLTVSVDLAFGRVGHRKTHRNLPRLSALPSPTTPVAIYLGVIRGTRTAVFLVPSDVHAEGDGKCFPSAKDCQTIHLNAGGTEFFDVFDSAGNTKQYELDLTHMTFRRVDSPTEASKAFLRASSQGTQAFKASGARLGLRYDTSIGRLVPVSKPAQRATPTVSSDAASSSPVPLAGPAPASSLGSLRDHGAGITVPTP